MPAAHFRKNPNFVSISIIKILRKRTTLMLLGLAVVFGAAVACSSASSIREQWSGFKIPAAEERRIHRAEFCQPRWNKAGPLLLLLLTCLLASIVLAWVA